MLILGTHFMYQSSIPSPSYWSRGKVAANIHKSKDMSAAFPCAVPQRSYSLARQIAVNIRQSHVHACQTLWQHLHARKERRHVGKRRGTYPLKYEDESDEGLCTLTISACSLRHSFIFMHVHTCRQLSSRMRMFTRRGSRHVAAYAC